MGVVVPELLLKILYPPPPSLFISAMSVISFASLANAGFMEIKGKHMKYSKFANLSSDKNHPKLVSGKTGMLIAYTPALLAGLASFTLLLPIEEGLRFQMLQSALTIHFFKRVIEVLCIHRYSGGMEIDTAIPISISYFLSTVTLIYTQHLTNGHPEPSIDLKFVGLALFFIGIIGNFYHHFLLSRLRSPGEKQYKIPRGGMFDLVICPHYLFEILGFVGVTCISQTVYALAFTLGTACYLSGRSLATREWYKSKFDDFPENTKALIPFIF
ncbi:OLC1v1026464C1 [Oldenlandia corymbosa var. corymbosa]|uniref:OLC1v1026464C1 n=1 Tax=Oldenlandia corymbosa var. corymbosa TaxID=529605 RepID=A0AAV1C7J5_OLDCO|nr:OLC1v1026464C1 [Oldenlandia corymbosa var. corymbosa]